MKKIHILYIVAAVFALSCQREPMVETGSMESIGKDDVFTAVLENGEVKASIGKNLKSFWDASDAISVFTSSYNQQFVFNGKDGDVTGTFTPAAVEEDSFIAANALKQDAVYAVYPYSCPVTDSFKYSEESGIGYGKEYQSLGGNGIDVNGNLLVEVPRLQKYSPDVLVSPESNIMIAVTSSAKDRTLSFKNLLSYIDIPVTGKGSLINVILSSNDGAVMSGMATVAASYGSNPEIISFTNGYTQVVVYADAPVELSENEPAHFCFCVPPMEMASGFNVFFTFESGERVQVSSSASRKVRRNNVYTMETIRVEEPEYKTFVNPANGSTRVTFEEIWWDEIHYGVIKYKELDDRYECIAECTEDGIGIWGDSVGATIEFIIYKDKYASNGHNLMEVPLQYMGFDYNGWGSVPLDQASQPMHIADAVLFDSSNPQSYFIPSENKFVFNIIYYIPNVGSFKFYEESVIAHF